MASTLKKIFSHSWLSQDTIFSTFVECGNTSYLFATKMTFLFLNLSIIFLLKVALKAKISTTKTINPFFFITSSMTCPYIFFQSSFSPANSFKYKSYSSLLFFFILLKKKDSIPLFILVDNISVLLSIGSIKQT